MSGFVSNNAVRWNAISTAPQGRSLHVQVADNFGDYPLPFPCILTEAGWVHAETRKPLAIKPTGWREGRSLPRPRRTTFAAATKRA